MREREGENDTVGFSRIKNISKHKQDLDSGNLTSDISMESDEESEEESEEDDKEKHSKSSCDE